MQLLACLPICLSHAPRTSEEDEGTTLQFAAGALHYCVKILHHFAKCSVTWTKIVFARRGGGRLQRSPRSPGPLAIPEERERSYRNLSSGDLDL